MIGSYIGIAIAFISGLSEPTYSPVGADRLGEAAVC